MENEKIEKLKSLCGRKFRYNNREFKILTFKQTEDLIEIITDDGDWIKTNVYDLGVIISKLKEITVPLLRKDEIDIKPKFIAVKNEAVDRSQYALLEMLEKISAFPDNKKLLTQAKAVISVSDAIIRTEKMKVELLTAVNSL